MIYTPKTKKAMIIAYNAHNGQVDKSGIPYIYHPIHLAEQMDTETEYRFKIDMSQIHWK